jgi:hypothetical protein
MTANRSDATPRFVLNDIIEWHKNTVISDFNVHAGDRTGVT